MTGNPLRPALRHVAARAGVPLVLALALTGCAGSGDPTPASDRADDPTTSPSEQPAIESPAESPSEPTTSASPATKQALPLYFVGDGPDGPRLFREFHPGDGSDALTKVAAAIDGGASPLDADYRTLWPGDTVTRVERTDESIVVTLAGDAFTDAPDGMGRRQAQLAIQQLVYSLQGAAQARLPLVFVRDSGEPRLFGLDVSRPVRQSSALRVLNLVSITSPAEGASVPTGTLEVSGVANSFEASGPCQLARQGDVVDLVPFVAEGWMGERLFPFTATFEDVEPGTYVLTCSTDDPTGGTEGIGAMSDTKVITVS